jgi:hypothetical protein
LPCLWTLPYVFSRNPEKALEVFDFIVLDGYIQMKHNKPQHRSIFIVVDPVDQNRLNSFFRQELGFYNTLVGTFGSRVRAFPQTILNITHDQASLFCDLAKYNLNIRELVKKPQEWPEQLKSYFPVAFDRLTQKTILTEAQIMMFESAGANRWIMIPEAKKQMARAVIDFYKEQADILAHPQSSDIIEVAYKTPPSSLSELEISNKRHAQIPRNEIKYKYNNTEQHTEIWTPLTTKPIIIPHFNLNEYNRWTTAIVKQESGRFCEYNTPWVIDFKNTKNNYLLKYLDSTARSPGNYRISNYA